jgi:DNA-damage-inducible protein J
VSDAVRILLVRVAAEKALPFEVKVPNRTTVKAMEAADQRKGKRFKSARALFEDLGVAPTSSGLTKSKKRLALSSSRV